MRSWIQVTHAALLFSALPLAFALDAVPESHDLDRRTTLLAPRTKKKEEFGEVQCLDVWPDLSRHPLFTWPLMRGPEYYGTLKYLCAATSKRRNGPNMGCVCRKKGRFKTLECGVGQSDPGYKETTFLLNWCRDFCSCHQSPVTSSSEEDLVKKLTSELERWKPQQTYDSVGPNDPGHQISGTIYYNPMHQACGKKRCSYDSLACGPGCSCQAEQTSRGWIAQGCITMSSLASLGGKRKRDEHDVAASSPTIACACNTTYISTSCCTAPNGIVDEPHWLKLGELSSSNPDVPTSKIDTRSPNIEPRTTDIEPGTPATISSRMLDRNSVDSRFSRFTSLDLSSSVELFPPGDQLDCQGEMPPDRRRGMWYPPGWYASDWSSLQELCALSDERDDTVGCACSPHDNSPLCLERYSHPELWIRRGFRRHCLLWCRCRAPRSSSGSEESKEPIKEIPAPTTEPQEEPKGSRQPTCEKTCSRWSFSCFGGVTVKDDDQQVAGCHCAAQRVGVGLWDIEGCRPAVSSLVGAIGALSGRGVEDPEYACPCNRTYVSTRCCGAEGGLVWEHEGMRLGVLV